MADEEREGRWGAGWFLPELTDRAGDRTGRGAAEFVIAGEFVQLGQEESDAGRACIETRARAEVVGTISPVPVASRVDRPIQLH